MKIVFCGTPRFAVPTLEALLAAGHDIALVVSQPDRPVGRSQALTAPPVKLAAYAAGLAQQKFGGDSALEMQRNFAGYIEQIRRY